MPKAKGYTKVNPPMAGDVVADAFGDLYEVKAFLGGAVELLPMNRNRKPMNVDPVFDTPAPYVVLSRRHNPQHVERSES